LLGMPRFPSRPDDMITNSQRSLSLSILPAETHRASQGAEACTYRRFLPGCDYADCQPLKIHRLQCDRL
jgi:hypothetical protein